MKVNIRPLEEKYLDGIVLIENESFSTPWSKQSYRDEINNPVAEYTVFTDENDSVIAYGGFWSVCDEADITNIAVKKEFRQNHLGQELLSLLISSAKGKNLRAVTLEVRISNTPAINLYKKAGFVSSGARLHYYPDGEDALIMWLEL